MPLRPATLAFCTASLFARAALALADPADHPDQLAQRWGPFGSGSGSGSGGDNPFGGGGDGSGGSSGSGSGSGFPGLFGTDLQSAIHYRTVHGILASVAMVVLFPVGAILMRIVPGRLAIWCHALFQIMAYMLYIAGAALGIYLVRTVHLPFAFAGSGNLLTSARTNYHPILGLLVLATLFFQPLLGYIHHARFKQLGRRTVWSHLHLWNGRIGITIGIIDGGLGLRLARAPHSAKVAYIVVAVLLWALWMLVAVVSESRRARRTRASPRAVRDGAASDLSTGYYAARRPGHGRHGSRGSRRSHTPDPEMSAARAAGPPSGAAPARPRRGDRAPKTRQSHSSASSRRGS